MRQRIQNVLAELGVDSKRHIEEMVLQGRIAVNGKVSTSLPLFINPARDHVTVDDEVVDLSPAAGDKGDGSAGTKYYILLNKPKDVVCTNVAQGAQRRAIDYLPENFPARMYPVGRLDADSRGLLLLTNDGDLTQKLTHPRFGVVKTYRAIVDGRVEGDTLQKLEHGVYLIDRETGQGFKTARTIVKVINRTHIRSTLEITIKEGRNRQIRRVLAKLGHKVRELTRVKMGPLALGDLPVGECRQLTHQEIAALRRAAEASAAPAEPVNEAPPILIRPVGASAGKVTLAAPKAPKAASPGKERPAAPVPNRKKMPATAAPRPRPKPAVRPLESAPRAEAAPSTKRRIINPED